MCCCGSELVLAGPSIPRLLRTALSPDHPRSDVGDRRHRVLAYFFLGLGLAGPDADDGRWATVFLANFHFTAVGTDYLDQHAAALSAPELLVPLRRRAVLRRLSDAVPSAGGLRTRLSLRARLAIGLVVVIGGSFSSRSSDTARSATGAYFSPFTRAWELALGALVAVGTPWLKKLPAGTAALATWLGFGAILVAAFAFNSQTAYPGSLVAIPVVGAALIIAAGVKAPRFGAEALLGLAPFRGLGKLSYSLYLWHWPILIIAAEYAGTTSLSVAQNLGWVLVALLASVLTYVLVENPIRHAKPLLRIRWASVGFGAVLVGLALGVVTVQSNLAGGSDVDPRKATPSAAGPSVPLQIVRRLVVAADGIQTVPEDLIPALSQADSSSNLGIPPVSTGCWPGVSQGTVPACTFGDRLGTRTMILYGDSHAGMWFRALDDIATRAHWKLVILTKGSCPAAALPSQAPGTTGDWVACDQWHQFAINRINRIDPNLLVISQAAYELNPDGRHYTVVQWKHGLEQLLRRVTAAKTVKLVLGDPPVSGGPDCLAQHTDDVQACSLPPVSFLTPYNKVERLAAAAEGARYVSVTPWFCAKRCSSVIGPFSVYYLTNHVAVRYSLFLENVLQSALDLASFTQANAPRH